MYVKFANGSEAKVGVPVNSGVVKSVLAAVAMEADDRRQRGNEWQVVLQLGLHQTHPCCQMPNGVHP